ncbi:minor tail protein [Mycobacterium phage Camperdownii]|uniref:Glycine-rich domain-containing protein n=1 Tax=Mycobacterium phage Camperdownii TaxID=1927024 RepID=A0A1L5C0H2_9CAUD|nr:minor tail protein [Mycobacterium phage Camperdownii]APL99599.1 hypothetical protein SEA_CAMPERDOWNII_5 [Mycobacterium phage Camperdownii]
MPIRFGSIVPVTFRLGTVTPTRIFQGDRQVWPEFAEVRQQFTNTGNYSFTIPALCHRLDIILLGGGGGGQGMGNATAWGKGGDAGNWQIVTLVRGIDIPWTTTQITGSVGVGGTAGAGGLYLGNNGPGGPGGNTTAVITGVGTLTALGGAGGHERNLDTTGKSPGTRNVNGIDYVGGAEADGIAGSQAGNPPGGGGQASRTSTGFFGIAGGAGARGQAWIRAYI